ncbi:flavin-containing monooxygenase [Nesterenkonia sedimenti]|uniref:flavin-containing monooxygenase n=1 Tax=Nesterenkonia sedimenti TaxID=1463632 RepID=UPI00389952D9
MPGFDFPGEPGTHPGKDKVADYLATYAQRYALPVHLDTRMTRLNGAAGDFRLRFASREPLRARAVVVATGAFGSPFVPGLANRLDPQVLQIHSEDYRNPSQLRGDNVSVVGGGNSGFQIALELANQGKRVSLSEGAGLRSLPQRLLGRDLFWWLTTTGLIGVAGSSRLGRRLRANEPVIGTSRRRLRRAAVSFRPRTVEAHTDRLSFEDGTNIKVDTVVWTTGYRHDDTWIDIPGALNENGALTNQDGVTPVEGLYTLGRPWQRDRGSSLLGYVRRDAERLAHRLAREAS